MRYQRMQPENRRPCGFGLISGLLMALILLSGGPATATATAYQVLPGDVQSERSDFAYDAQELRVVLWLGMACKGNAGVLKRFYWAIRVLVLRVEAVSVIDG